MGARRAHEAFGRATRPLTDRFTCHGGTGGFIVGVYLTNTGLVFGESTTEYVMKGVIAVILGTMGYIMIGVALAGMG
jgi:hypothetical protein